MYSIPLSNERQKYYPLYDPYAGAKIIFIFLEQLYLKQKLWSQMYLSHWAVVLLIS